MALVVDGFLREYTGKSCEDSGANTQISELMLRLAEGHKTCKHWTQLLPEEFPAYMAR